MSERIFIGRQNELATLQQAWHRAKQGQPQMVVLLGETGLGKTRIVQEFYGWLSETDIEDPQGYWPDTLQIGRSLELNPPADTINLQVQIPWLWWGMRFHPVDERNQATIRRSPFEEDDPNLVVHAEPIMRKRKIRAARKEAAKSLGGIFADMLTAGVAGTVLSINELRKQRSQEKIETEALASDAATLVKKRTEEINETVLALLSWFMDSKITDAPTVPVILVLDDAQWSDPATARSVDAILAKAAQRNWQLLIVATHWQREWEEQRQSHQAGEEDLGSFFQAFQRWSLLNADSPDAASLLRLAKLDQDSLLPVVQSKLPGITNEHKRRLLDEADGNPRALDEMIQLLVAKPEHFRDKNSLGTLSRRGTQRLALLQNTSLFEKSRQRFDDLSSEIQDVLSCGSLFGASFLRPMVEEILQQCELDEDWTAEDRIDEKLQEAERIHALIQQLSQNNHEFQQRVYHEVASRYLADDAELEDARKKTLDARILHWLKAEHQSHFESQEQETFLAFVVDYYLSAPESHEAWAKEAGNAFSEYLQALHARGAESAIVTAWKKVAADLEHLPDAFVSHAAYGAGFVLVLARNAQEDQAQAKTLLDALDQAVDRLVVNDFIEERVPDVKIRLSTYFEKFTGQIERAQAYAEESYELTRGELAKHGETPERLRDVSVSLNKLGDLALQVDGDAATARQHFEETLALARRILDQFGETPERLRDVSVSLEKLGDLALKVDGDAATARQHFEECLALTRRILKQFGETSERLRNVSISLDNLGDLALQVDGDDATARQHFEDYRALTRHILEQFGETPERLRDVSVSLYRLGDLALQVDGDAATARQHFEETLALARRILDQFGETPERLRDVSVSQDRLGDLALQVDGDAATARQHFEETLTLARRILDQFGETPERLRDVSVSLEKLGDLALKVDGDAATARQHFEETLALRRLILEQFGETPERLRDVSVSLDRLGDLALQVDGDAATARQHFEECLALTRRILKQFGETSERLRDVSVSLDRLGDLALQVDGDAATARKHFEESLALARRILEQFGETPARLRDVSVSLDRLGDLALQVDGDAATARQHFEECLALARRILEQFGETPERLRDVSLSLDRLGDLALQVDGDAATARQHFEETLALARCILEQFGETPERLRDVSVSLDRLGDLALKVDGDAATARQHFEETLALARRILEQFGETPQRLRDVSVSLDRLGDLALKVDGDAATARQHFEETLALARRILEQFGETPQRLRDVSLLLNKLGDLALKVDGDAATARQHFEETLALARRILEQFGETPERLRDVSVSLDRLGDLALQVDGDAATARQHFEESLALARRILEQFGETPARLRDVSVSLNKLGNLAQNAEGDAAMAIKYFEDALKIQRRYLKLFSAGTTGVIDLSTTLYALFENETDVKRKRKLAEEAVSVICNHLDNNPEAESELGAHKEPWENDLRNLGLENI